MSLDHKDIGIALFIIGLLTFFIWAARAFVTARRQERAEPSAAAEKAAAPEEKAAAPDDKAAAPNEAPPDGASAEPAAEPEAPRVEPEAKGEPKAEPLAEPEEAPQAEAEKKPGAISAPAPAAEPEPRVTPATAPAAPARKPAAIEVPEPAVGMPKPKPSLAPKPALVKPRPKALKTGLKKTRGGFIAKLGGLFRGQKQIDEGLMEELEEVLYTADIGVRTSEILFAKVKEALGRKQLKDADAVWTTIKEEATSILSLEAPPLDISRAKPFVILTVGVNGVGKTTTIGKLAALFAEQGKRCVLAAGDTFRAAAVEQLEVWAKQVEAPIVKGKEGQDPSSVIFDAIKQAEREGYDVVIADTAGRLHTKVNLMEELEKIHRVSGKALDGAPHEILLVLDATTGQNAIQQANLFKESVKVSGIVLTKLDGTAKGGIILGICDELKIPVRFIGIGEGVEDLREFEPAEFAEALFTPAEEGEA